jgi:hypothetical protein
MSSVKSLCSAGGGRTRKESGGWICRQRRMVKSLKELLGLGTKIPSSETGSWTLKQYFCQYSRLFGRACDDAGLSFQKEEPKLLEKVCEKVVVFCWRLDTLQLLSKE